MRTAEFRWSQVRVSLFIALAGIIFFAAVFYFGLVGLPLSHNVSIYGNFDDVSGLSAGSTVEMEGVQVGQIAGMDLPDLATGKVPVTMTISRAALSRLGPSSVAFASSHALVGQRFVGLTVRKPNEPALKPGGMVQTRPGMGFETLSADTAQVLEELKVVLGQTERITSALADSSEAVNQGEGTLGKLIHDDSLYASLNRTVANARELTRKLDRGQGLLGALIVDKKLGTELRSSMDTVAMTADRIRDGQGLVGRITNNQETAARFDAVMANLDSVTYKLAEAQGTLGALISDRAMLGKLNSLITQADSLLADVHRNPQRYLKVQAF